MAQEARAIARHQGVLTLACTGVFESRLSDDIFAVVYY